MRLFYPPKNSHSVHLSFSTFACKFNVQTLRHTEFISGSVRGETLVLSRGELQKQNILYGQYENVS